MNGHCPLHPDALPFEITMHARDGCAACLADPDNLDGVYPEPTEPIVQVEYERGVCFCDCCGAVIRVVPRVRQEPRVVDVDGRGHRCERYIAGVMQRHGAPSMEPILRHYAAQPVVAPPLGADGKVPPRRRTAEAPSMDGVELPRVD